MKDGASVLATNLYDELSRLENRSYLDATSVAIGYEPDDDLASLDHAHSGGALNLDYLHNGAHQIRQIEASDESYLAGQSSPTASYTSNNMNQYTQVEPRRPLRRLRCVRACPGQPSW